MKPAGISLVYLNNIPRLMQCKLDSNRQSAIRWFHHCIAASVSLHRNQLFMIYRLIYGSNVIIACSQYRMDEKVTKMQTQFSIKFTTLKEEHPKYNDCNNIFGCTSILKAWWGGGWIDRMMEKRIQIQDLGEKRTLERIFSIFVYLSIAAHSLYMFIIEMENREKY